MSDEITIYKAAAIAEADQAIAAVDELLAHKPALYAAFPAHAVRKFVAGITEQRENLVALKKEVAES